MNRGDLVTFNISLWNKIKSLFYYYYFRGKWIWLPKYGEVIGFRADMYAWEFKVYYGTFLVTPEKLEIVKLLEEQKK